MSGTRVVPLLAVLLVVSGCLSRATQDKLEGLERDKQAATDHRLGVQAELDKLQAELAAASTADEVARLEGLLAEAKAKLDLAKVQEALAISTLTTAKAGAEAERLSNGVQIAEWANQGIGGILSIFFPAFGPIVGIIGAVLTGMKKKEEEAKA